MSDPRLDPEAIKVRKEWHLDLGAAVAEVKAERAAQLQKWGFQDHSDDRWLTILLEEIGEFAKASLEGDIEGRTSEARQVAAVALAIFQKILSGRAGGV